MEINLDSQKHFEPICSVRMSVSLTVVSKNLEIVEHIIKFCVFIDIFQLMIIVLCNSWHLDSIIRIHHDQIAQKE